MNEKVIVALVITAIVTSMMSGPLIQWAMREKAAVRDVMISIDR
ncbi:MAG: hypothetical protein Q7J56_02885 [Deltaproteobacteria bacterium]|nr:hypothetical protein [Deltaproteobacteria bacterium]